MKHGDTFTAKFYSKDIVGKISIQFKSEIKGKKFYRVYMCQDVMGISDGDFLGYKFGFYAGVMIDDDLTCVNFNCLGEYPIITDFKLNNSIDKLNSL